MSFTAYLPRLGLFEKPSGKRRAPDEIERLNRQLDGAKLLIKGLNLQLDEKDREHEAAIARIDERHGEIVRGLEQQNAELQWRLEIACKAESAVAITQQLDVSGLRDNYADGVLTLQQAHGIGPVRDPGRLR
ncbi:hypothetical protein [Streptomyces sp. NPDC004230]